MRGRVVRRPHPSRDGRRVREALLAYAYLSPALVLLLIFTLGPFAYVFYASLLHTPGAATERFAGLENYTYLLDPAQQSGFWAALSTTFYYVAGVVPAGVALSLVCALLLYPKVRGWTVFRTLFFLPYVTPALSTAIIWLWIFNPQYGLLNAILRGGHLPAVGWTNDPHWAMPAVIIYSLWQSAGFNTVVLLSSLASIPTELQESARVEGAGEIAVARHITLPLLTPTIFFVLVVATIESFKVFSQIYALTGGGPAGATTTIAFFIYSDGFSFFHLDLASAVSVLLLALIMAFIVLQGWISRRWVFYG